jgi:hypothetical protein
VDPLLYRRESRRDLLLALGVALAQCVEYE